MVEYNGVIRNVYEDERMFDILYKGQIVYFYMVRSLYKKFEPYLISGYMISVNVQDDKKTINNILCNSVCSFNKISKVVGNKETIYYDKSEIKKSFNEILKKDQNRLFIDLEFTMPPFDYHSEDKSFYSEIVQYGIILEDSDGNVLDTEEGYIRPRCKKGINERTLGFLGVDQNKLLKADYYSEFYHKLKDYMMLYRPVIYIWGKNDYLMINQSFTMNKVEPIVDRSEFINLMQLFKTYYSLRDDLGLYKAYDLFHKLPPMQVQDHNPLHDAMALKELFHLFVKELEK